MQRLHLLALKLSRTALGLHKPGGARRVRTSIRALACRVGVVFSACLLLLALLSAISGKASIGTRHRKLAKHGAFSDDALLASGDVKDRRLRGNVKAQLEATYREGKFPESPKPSPVQPQPPTRGFYALQAKDIDGNDVPFSQFAGKVVLITNVASACGFTEQNYKGLETLYAKYGRFGLEILAFPSNQFASQEPGDEAQIKQFAQSRFNVTFRMMSKVDVNGENAHPVFKYLKRHLPAEQGGGGGVGPGKDITWNFNKFIVDRHGRPVAFHYQNFDTARIEADVYSYLARR